MGGRAKQWCFVRLVGSFDSLAPTNSFDRLRLTRLVERCAPPGRLRLPPARLCCNRPRCVAPQAVNAAKLKAMEGDGWLGPGTRAVSIKVP
jgi:hypothetical protein